MGGTYRTFYSDTLNGDAIGQITGSSTVSRFPNVAGCLFRLQAKSTNIGSFFIGTSSGTGKQAWELKAGYDSDWFTLSNHNLDMIFFSNPSGSSQVLAYWVKS